MSAVQMEGDFDAVDHSPISARRFNVSRSFTGLAALLELTRAHDKRRF